jgi:soluble P-type ATPase
VIPIPGRAALELRDLVLDFNGTLAADGVLLPEVAALLRALAPTLDIHVLTADTHGTAPSALAGLPLTVRRVERGAEKRALVEGLGAPQVVAIGNGRNDEDMFQVAGLAVVVVGPEGASAGALAAAHVVVPDIRTALALLRKPKRLTATLRP